MQVTITVSNQGRTETVIETQDDIYKASPQKIHDTIDRLGDAVKAHFPLSAESANKPNPSPFRANPVPPSEEELARIYATNFLAKNNSHGGTLTAIWRAGCDAGMVAP